MDVKIVPVLYVQYGAVRGDGGDGDGDGRGVEERHVARLAVVPTDDMDLVIVPSAGDGHHLARGAQTPGARDVDRRATCHGN